QQFFGYVVFLGAHCAYGQSGLRRRLIVRLHKILHTLLLGILANALISVHFLPECPLSSRQREFSVRPDSSHSICA
ncbi:hypothetical protein, partial [Comamonas thiooxydans]